MPYFALRPRLAASLRRMANRLDPEQRKHKNFNLTVTDLR